MRNKLIYIIWFAVYFLIHYYIEYLPNIGSVSVAQLWKIPLIVFLIGYNLLSKSQKNTFEKIGYILAIEYMLSPETITNPLKSVILATKPITLILLFGYMIPKYRRKPEVAEKWLYAMAQFIPLLSLPFLIGIIQPIKEYIDAGEHFGVEGLVYYTAAFGSGHCASSYFCASILTLLYGFKTKRFKTNWSKIFNILLIIISLVSTFRAYTRTGWLMLIVGIFTLYSYKKITIKHLRNIAITLFTVFIGIIALYNYSEAFHARIIGTSVNNTSTDKIETGGSGRTKFWENAIVGLYNQNNIYYSLFGQGITIVKKYNLKTTGMEVFSHNQFLDALSQHGLFGIILLCIFYWYIYKYIRLNKSPYQKLCYALFFSNLIFAFFQNEMYFDYAVIFAFALSLTHITSAKQIKYE
jgi:hypothetical protein